MIANPYGSRESNNLKNKEKSMKNALLSVEIKDR